MPSPEAAGYSLCTGVGWVRVDGPANPKGNFNCDVKR
jgi:hypothetical protein